MNGLRRLRRFGTGVVLLSLFIAGTAAANHSPGVDQTPGNVRAWTDRPGWATNNPPLGQSQVFLIGWSPSFVGNPAAALRWVDRGVAGIDISGEGIFGDTTERRISVFYNNDTCAINADRSGHLAHVEWVPSFPFVSGAFRYIGGAGQVGYRIHVPITSVKSISVRRFVAGGDFPETEANTVLEACYSFALGTRRL